MTVMEDDSSKTPKCGRCRNHGMVVRLKGHKTECPRKDCMCSKCILNVFRRNVMAAQTALKKPAADEPDRRPSSRGSSLSARCESPPDPSPRTSPISTTHSEESFTEDDAEVNSHSVMSLMSHFGLEWNLRALPFAHAVIKLVGDLSKSVRLVEQAQREFQQLPENKDVVQPQPAHRPPIVSHVPPYLVQDTGPLPLVIDSPRRAKIPRTTEEAMDLHYAPSLNSSCSTDKIGFSRYCPPLP